MISAAKLLPAGEEKSIVKASPKTSKAQISKITRNRKRLTPIKAKKVKNTSEPMSKKFDMDKLDDLLKSLQKNTESLAKVTQKDVKDEEKEAKERKETKQRVKAQDREEKTEAAKVRTEVKKVSTPKIKTPAFITNILRTAGRVAIGMGIIELLKFLSDPEKKDGLIRFLSDHMDKLVLGFVGFMGIAVASAFAPIVGIFTTTLGIMFPILKALVGLLLSPKVLLAALITITGAALVKDLFFRPVGEYDQITGDAAQYADPKLTSKQRLIVAAGIFGTDRSKWPPKENARIEALNAASDARDGIDPFSQPDYGNDLSGLLGRDIKPITPPKPQEPTFGREGMNPRTGLPYSESPGKSKFAPQTPVVPTPRSVGGPDRSRTQSSPSRTPKTDRLDRDERDTPTTPMNVSGPRIVDEYKGATNTSKFPISSPYGDRIHPITGQKRFHSGVDIAPDPPGPGYYVGLKVPGTVTRVDFDPGNPTGYGHFVIISSQETGMSYMFAHLAQVDVRTGDQYLPGEPIGEIGNTGGSTGIHLHYEVYKGGKDGPEVDPTPYMDLLTIGKITTDTPTEQANLRTSVTNMSTGLSFQTPYEQSGQRIAMIQVPVPMPLPTPTALGDDGGLSFSSGSRVNTSVQSLALVSHYREA